MLIFMAFVFLAVSDVYLSSGSKCLGTGIVVYFLNWLRTPMRLRCGFDAVTAE